ncbi:MAG: NAD(P)/FAD-dependent oxidoreductase [Bernardetiaceae bacterium]|nr:NAD(P)/FAD-dependent oxidoreductase [Bernardetiaceae bacterium]
MNHTKYQVLVLGGGNAGISAAAQLLIARPDLEVAILEPSETHYYQPAWTLVGGGDFDIKKTARPQAECMPEKAKWIKGRAKTFLPEENAVITDAGERLEYEYLIVALGIQIDWHKIKGLEESIGKNGVSSNYSYKYAPYTFECVRQLKGGTAIFTNPNTPIKCGGAPQKIMYLASDYFRKNGLLNKIEVNFCSAGGVIFGVKKYADTLNKVIERYGIKTNFKENLVEIRGDEKIAVFDRTNPDGNIEKVERSYDFLHVTPPQSAPDCIKESPLADKSNAFGWVDVDKHTLQHNRFPNVFSLGDVSSTPNAKTGAAVRKQAPVLVQNLLKVMDNQALDQSYNGYGSCPLVTGYGKLVLAEFDYNNEPAESFALIDQSKERYSMYLLKKYGLPFLYWNKILKGTA